jgi:bla regulator protein blaR1
MQRIGNVIGIRRKLLLRAAGLAAVAVTVVFGLVNATPSRAQSQAQNTAAVAPAYEFEAASIKPNKSHVINFRPGFTLDGYRAEDASVQWLIREAYGVQDYGLSGAPDWLKTERYDVEAKMEASVADALGKLPPDQLQLARQQMLQALLAERFNLKIHRETKEEPVYLLGIGKNGPKLQDAKPGDTHTFPGADGSAVLGRIQIGPGSGGGQKARAFAVSMKMLGEWLSRELTRPVLDRTGLTGAYDFTLEWMPDMALSPTPDAANADSLPGNPMASIFTAVQQQLGLKLEPGKGPIEVVVIDHVDRPSGN